jgi:putative DNA primase/helicase|nr:MAG TPA: dsDNA helicase [Caudoviricetes sp.]
MLEYAKAYDKLGWVVMPIKPNDKRPIIKNWSKIQSNDETLDKFKDTSNIGIIMGATSNLVCIDVDVKNADGVATLEKLEEQLGELPQTVMSETPSGGIHYYFKYVKGIRNRKNVGEGIDIQADGTQTVEAPSQIDGTYYEWVNSPFEYEIAELPQKWKQYLCEEVDEDTLLLSNKPFEAPSEVEEGGRNNTLASYVGSLLGKKLKKATVLKKALKYNEESCNPPLDEDEVKTIVDSMIKTDKTNKANNVEKSINESKLDSSNEDDLKVDWISFDETGTVNINDKKFAEWYVKRNELYCINDRFYTRYGQISDNEFRNNIHNIIGGIITTRLSAKVESLLASVKNEAFTKLDAPDKYKVQFDNISFDVRHGKLEECDTFFTLHQIPHNYDAKADCPKFKRFINNLFYEEDIPVIQEYLGYCLVPNTLAQTALFIIGEGGEGKSRIPVLMEHIIGADNVVVGDFEGLQDKFSTSSLDKQMLFMDDELTLTALDDTSNFKKIVTAETAMEVEVKGKPKYKTKLYSRIICCGNGAIQSKFDRTDGFYRRLLLCKVRPVHYDKPDRTLSDQLDKEIPGIINWMLEGLCRVVKNGFIIEPSKRMSDEVQSLRDNSDTIQLFMNDEQFIDYTFDEEDKVSIKQLYDAYENWCQDNSYLIIHKNTFGKTIRRTYKSTLSKKLMNPQRVNELISKEKVYINKKQVRGVVGIKLKNYKKSFTVSA